MPTREAVPSRYQARRTIRAALLGAVPGGVLLLVTWAAISGEAELTFGVLAIGLTVAGALTGAVLAAQVGLRARPMAVGATIGAVCGLVTMLVFPPLGVVVLLVGPIAGGIWFGRRARDAERG